MSAESAWSERTVGSLAEMETLATRVAARLTGGTIVLLVGELGAGKTTFVQAVARAMGVVEPVVSPTYTLMTNYPVAGHPTIAELVHLDLYRLPSSAGQPDAHVGELIAAITPQQIMFIEWPERLGAALPTAAERLEFRHGAHPQERVVRGTLITDG